MPADDLRARWIEDWTALSGDVHRVHMNRDIFEALDEEIAKRKVAGSGTFLDVFFRPMYAEGQAGLLRRLGDDDVRSRSFRILLDEMILRPKVVSRDHYVCAASAFYDADPDYVRPANDDFDEVAGTGAPHVPVTLLYRLRRELNADLERITEFVNKNVAHRDRVASPALLWHELNDAIEPLEQHLNAAGRLLTGKYLVARPTIIGDWRAVFRDGLFPLAERRHRRPPPSS